MSTLVIGDIHGCYNELQALVDAAGIGSDDRIIALGDLLDKGRQPGRVLDFFLQTPNASSIRGNHEHYHLIGRDEGAPPSLANFITHWKLSDAKYHQALDYFDSLPLYHELDEALLVHGYYEPGVPLDDQRDDVLLGLDSGNDYLRESLDMAWFQAYDRDKPIIVGHKDYTTMQKPLIISDRVYAIDTRCVFGGELTGVLLPEWKIIRVPARSNHWKKVKKKHALD